MRQPSLFDDGAENNEPSVPGLQYIPEYITEDQEQKLIAAVDKKEWLTELKRRVQHYGFKYNYKRGVKKLDPAPALPRWAVNLAQKLQRDALAEELPDQLIINEYEPGQGISAHVDREELFGGVIISVSLGSPCVMEFINNETRERVALLLERRSALVMKGEARHQWKHAIPARLVDTHEGERIKRERRVSLTFRKTIEQH